MADHATQHDVLAALEARYRHSRNRDLGTTLTATWRGHLRYHGLGVPMFESIDSMKARHQVEHDTRGGGH